MQADGFIDQIGAGTEPGAVDDNSSKMKNNISYKLKSEWFQMDEWWGGGKGEVLPDSVDKCDRMFAGWLMRFLSILHRTWSSTEKQTVTPTHTFWPVTELRFMNALLWTVLGVMHFKAIDFMERHSFGNTISIDSFYWGEMVPLQHLLILANTNFYIY